MTLSLLIKYLIVVFLKWCVIPGMRVPKIWQFSVPPKYVALENKLWKKWRPNVRGSKEDDICIKFKGVPCVNTWSTLYSNSSIFPKSTWWTACWRTSPSSRWSPTGTPRRPSFASPMSSRSPPRSTELNITFTDWSGTEMWTMATKILQRLIAAPATSMIPMHKCYIISGWCYLILTPPKPKCSRRILKF